MESEHWGRKNGRWMAQKAHRGAAFLLCAGLVLSLLGSALAPMAFAEDDAAEPQNSTVQTEPAGGTGTSETTEPEEPAGPTEPAGGTDTSETTEPEEPTAPEEPAGGTGTSETTEPNGPEEPAGPTEPAGPDAANGAENAILPEQPAAPEEPAALEHSAGLCPHHQQHDAGCGFVEGQAGSPCNFVCEWCVAAWEWDDEEALLTYSSETGQWCLSLPGAGPEKDRIVTREVLQAMLPHAVMVTTAAGPSEAPVEVSWNLEVLPAEGAYEGVYLLTAALPQGYVLADGVPALEVWLVLGGAELYADPQPKYVNQWSFIDREGNVWDTDNNQPCEMTAIIEDLSAVGPDDWDAFTEHLSKNILPERIRAWGSTIKNDLNAYELADDYSFDHAEDVGVAKYETTKDGHKPYSGGSWARIRIRWEFPAFNADFLQGAPMTLHARIDPATKNNGDTYQVIVNTNIPAEITAGRGNTLQNPDMLTLTVTLQDMNLASHVVTPAAPQNVTVNLFDYWVRDYGEDPTAPQGDILDKNDLHKHEDENGNVTTATPFSTVSAWNLGINRGHLLLFGDGLIHAGLWNKGAGENCAYGRHYAGMERIVKSILPESGYPEINTANAKLKLLGVTDASQSNDPNYRNVTWVKDYNLCGDHDDAQPEEYTSIDVQNLSNTVIGTWGKNIDTETESLQYLFDPAMAVTVGGKSYKKSYENVTGLFQLDNEGYYYYNMRENFAEFSEENGNHFVLYDAPATIRTDNAHSVGNFFPFNKGSEVFTGLDAHNGLTSVVPCARNEMNHHLGMTVDVEFRQPLNGKIGSGASVKPMTFEFSGDDDVWVFIDNVLVLDLGGIHSEIYGTINFATGEVFIGRAFNTNGIPDNPADSANLVTQTSLKQLFLDALGQDQLKDSDWKDDTFASNTTHTLKMFYLERGNYDSSLALRFNLQPLLHQNIAKVDQNGTPLPGVTFALYPGHVVGENDAGAIQCLYTDDSGVVQNDVFYVAQEGSGPPLVTLTTDANGSAVFQMADGSYFNFADRGNQYYILREVTTPAGYRAQPVDLVLHYDLETAMLSVANRWDTGAYACSVSNTTGPQRLYYAGSIDPATGQVLASTSDRVDSGAVIDGLVVALPLLKQGDDGPWMALYGSNLTGFGTVDLSGGNIADWRAPILRAALEQAAADEYAAWHLDWDAGNTRLYGSLYDLPGLANRYLLNNPADGDLQMVYGIISRAALDALHIQEDTAEQRYAKLREYIQANDNDTNDGVDVALAAINRAGANAFRLVSADQFVRSFRSLIYVPNERRELRVMKIDQDGQPLQDARFGLFDNPDCSGTSVSSGVTNEDGMLIFSVVENGGGRGYAHMAWGSSNTRYYLRELTPPAGHLLNTTVIPVVVGFYGIYADAGAADDGVQVVADVGRLTQTMRQFAISDNVDITLQDITAYMQTEPSEGFRLDGWRDDVLEGTSLPRSMNLHYKRNEFLDYGLHDQDGGQIYRPFFSTDTGFVRMRIRQNFEALQGGQYDTDISAANKDNLGDTDLTNLFSQVNMVVVTDRTTAAVQTGRLTIGKRLTGENLAPEDYTKFFSFTVNLTDANGTPLDGAFEYHFYGSDKAGRISNGETLMLRHDEAITILGLPTGTRLTVTETPETGWYVLPQDGVYRGVISSDGEYEALFTNAKTEFPRTGSGALTLQKTVTGSEGDRTKAFAFAIQLDGQGSVSYNGASYTLPCTLTAALRHGEQMVLTGLPVGATYLITESGNEGYEVAKTGDTGMIVDGATSATHFVNHRDALPSEDPNAPDTPGASDGPGVSDAGGTNRSLLPQTGVNWRLTWLLAVAGALLLLAGVGQKLYGKNRHES